MKKFILLLTAPFILMYACSEDEFDTYDGKDFIYFSKRTEYAIDYWDTLKTFNFFFHADVTDTLFAIPVSTGAW
ncbi:MAG: hypothetical protein LUD68_08110 [Rikenellaceae bacterium]|nr:hypothetical protein [Rikenellaceae bacterium]